VRTYGIGSIASGACSAVTAVGIGVRWALGAVTGASLAHVSGRASIAGVGRSTAAGAVKTGLAVAAGFTLGA
jgi:hypothetical protein